MLLDILGLSSLPYELRGKMPLEIPEIRPVTYYYKSKRFYDRDLNHQHISAHQVEFPHFAPCAKGEHVALGVFFN